MSRNGKLLQDIARVAQGIVLVGGHALKNERLRVIERLSSLHVNNFPSSASSTEDFTPLSPPSPTPSPPQDSPNTVKIDSPPSVHTPVHPIPRQPIPVPSPTPSKPIIPIQSKPLEPPPPTPNPIKRLDENKQFSPRERAVPTGPLARIVGFGDMFARLAIGTVVDRMKKPFFQTENEGKTILSSTTSPSLPFSSTSLSQTSSSSSFLGRDPSVSVPSSQSTSSDFPFPSSSSSSLSSASPSSSSTLAPPPISPLTNVISEANAERLAAGLCRMRGAALKVGQMLSIQDESLIPPQLQTILARVRDGADVMPRRQLVRTLTQELGDDWESRVKDFDLKPIAAASIGQVHRAKLHNGTDVAMKVQYPGVADSIHSDVDNLKRLMRLVNILPKGMYLDESIESAKEELTLECDYLHEAQCQSDYRKRILADKELSKVLNVPFVEESLTTRRVLTTQMVHGVPIDKLADQTTVDQRTRNWVAKMIITLCLRELFLWKTMQTDPNWSNFLYDESSGVIHLIDFGATRTYPKSFVDEYLRMVWACAEKRRNDVIDSSIKLGFLTGDESRRMMDAHVEAGYIVGEPFATAEPYDFVKGNIPGRVSALASIMLKERLRPPPKEAYTLHRKLSGAFLTCKKLHATITCRNEFMELYNNYDVSTSK